MSVCALLENVIRVYTRMYFDFVLLLDFFGNR